MCKEEHTAKLQLEYDSVEHKETYDIDMYVCYMSHTRNTNLAGREVCLTKGFSKTGKIYWNFSFKANIQKSLFNSQAIERLINNAINIVSSILHYNNTISYMNHCFL